MTKVVSDAMGSQPVIVSSASGFGSAAGGDGPPVEASRTHLVVIPSYNSGRLLQTTVRAARSYWAPVWVVIDGSTDGSAEPVEAMAAGDPGIRVLRLPANRGKGAAVRHGVAIAGTAGFTHALVMDADDQHPAQCIRTFMALSGESPEAVVMGQPVFGSDAPWIRVAGRRVSNAMAAAITGRPVGDSLFGFRVYPIRSLLDAMQASRGMNRFDFDPEAVIRLGWKGLPLVHRPAPVRYLDRAEEGVSHFHYLRDNLLLIQMFARLCVTAIGRACGGRIR